MTSLLHVVTSAHAWTLKDGTEHPTGFWASEFIEPHRTFLAAGLEVTVATPGGIQAIVDEVSLAPAMNNNDESLIAAQRAYLDDVKDLLTHPVALETVNPADYDAVFVSGGHGPMQDLAEDPAIGRVVTALLFDPHKVVSAVCHGTAAFLPARASDGSWPFQGRRLTGFTDEEETLFGFGDTAPWLLETRLSHAGARFIAGAAFGPNVVVDENIVTGQNPASAGPTAEAVLAALTARPAGA